MLYRSIAKLFYDVRFRLFNILALHSMATVKGAFIQLQPTNNRERALLNIRNDKVSFNNI